MFHWFCVFVVFSIDALGKKFISSFQIMSSIIVMIDRLKIVSKLGVVDKISYFTRILQRDYYYYYYYYSIIDDKKSDIASYLNNINSSM